MLRRPYRAGSFYEADESSCRSSAERLLRAAALPAELPGQPCGGLVPHAGWVFSGRTAAVTFKALARAGRLGRVILFGADHWGTADGAAVFDRGSWLTPLGEVPVDEELAAALLQAVPGLRADPKAHEREHSIEVQLPLMQMLSPDLRVVPINISPTHQAAKLGQEVGQLVQRDFPEVSVVGSTDLTHYGPSYGFSPGGHGTAGLEWARDNDQRLLELVQAMQAEQVIDEAAARNNACGAGAIAATITASAALGATAGVCLEYTSSAEVMEKVYSTRADDCVGYAAVVFA